MDVDSACPDTLRKLQRCSHAWKFCSHTQAKAFSPLFAHIFTRSLMYPSLPSVRSGGGATLERGLDTE
jgi:hypothetical protein